MQASEQDLLKIMGARTSHISRKADEILEVIRKSSPEQRQHLFEFVLLNWHKSERNQYIIRYGGLSDRIWIKFCAKPEEFTLVLEKILNEKTLDFPSKAHFIWEFIIEHEQRDVQIFVLSVLLFNMSFLGLRFPQVLKTTDNSKVFRKTVRKQKRAQI